MFGRSRTPASERGLQRRMAHQIHPRTRPELSADWMGAHRAAQIDARCRQAQDRAIRIARGRWRQC